MSWIFMCWCKTWLSNIHLLFTTTTTIIISSWKKKSWNKSLWGGQPWYQGIDVLLRVMFIAWGWLSDPVSWLFFLFWLYILSVNSHYCKSLGELLRLEIRLFSFWQNDYIIIHYDRMLKDGFACFCFFIDTTVKSRLKGDGLPSLIRYCWMEITLPL